MGEEKKQLLINNKVIIVAVALVAAILSVIGIMKYRANNLKENIHSEMWEIFSEENMNITDEQAEYIHIGDTFNNEGFSMLDYFEYNETKYYYYFDTISEALVDTSEVLTEATRFDDEGKKAKVYRIKGVSESYMLVAEIGGVYYQYKTRTQEPKDIKEYFDKVGSEAELCVEYVEVILMEKGEELAIYIYANEIAEWVWNLLLSNTHDFEGWIPCECTSGEEYVNYPDKYVGFSICIRSSVTNTVLTVDVLPNGNVGICNGMAEGQEAEFMFSTAELLDAFQILVKDYEACKVR